MTIITKDLLYAIAHRGRPTVLAGLEPYMDDALQKYGINTHLRVSHFLGQAAEETDGFNTLEEYASGAGYEGRRDLGNTEPGDGVRFKGRGIFQLTGRANYRQMGAKLGIDLENNPTLAADPKISILTACEYWNTKGLSPYADKDDINTITQRINGGFNGLVTRTLYTNAAKKLVPNDPIAWVAHTTPADPGTPPLQTIALAKRGDVSEYVRQVQIQLNNKNHAGLNPDGKFGPLTEQAVKNFQQSVGLPVTGIVDTPTINKLTA